VWAFREGVRVRVWVGGDILFDGTGDAAADGEKSDVDIVIIESRSFGSASCPGNSSRVDCLGTPLNERDDRCSSPGCREGKCGEESKDR
jgi:hypothetical protein